DVEALVEQFGTAQGDTEKPLGLSLDLSSRLFGNNEVGFNHIHILGNNGALDIGIIPNLARFSDSTKIGILDKTSKNLCRFTVTSLVWNLVNCHGRRLNVS